MTGNKPLNHVLNHHYSKLQLLGSHQKLEPHARFLFLTLTVKNVYDGKELNDCLSKMTKGFSKLFKKIRKQLQLDDVEDGDLTDISKESECVDDDVKTIVAEFDYQRKNYFIR
ncbi:hypothetical protein FE327_01505 [Dolosigranulum pigrum]|nr:hypothetical protein FE327_01505 [Dolosigranulum pigrum]QTJ46075.1 hypothetical protein FE329_01540 [Dolosigranulum pigrum]QTJ59591.1 hypothetical protein FE337_01540 [Dolosigranulum pigrum]